MPGVGDEPVGHQLSVCVAPAGGDHADHAKKRMPAGPCLRSNERGLRPGIWRAVRDPLPVYRRAGDDGVLVGGRDPV